MKRSKRSMRWIVPALLLVLSARGAHPQADAAARASNQPVEPYRILGNLYSVGASDVTSFLITTPQGHILLDGGFVETAPRIEENLKQLGFRIEDVRILLNGTRITITPAAWRSSNARAARASRRARRMPASSPRGARGTSCSATGTPFRRSPSTAS